MGMKTPTGNPLEIYLAFNPEEHWKVIESDTAPFISDDKSPEWYIKLSEFDAAQARIAALEAENERLRKALEFYADGKNYVRELVTEECGCCSYLSDKKIGAEGDRGEVARAALEAKP